MSGAIRVTATVLCVITELLMIYVLCSLVKGDSGKNNPVVSEVLTFATCIGQIMAIAVMWW